MRVARGMLHLRETLPLLFDPGARDLFPPEVYSKNVTLKLPAPLPFKVSSLHGYNMAFTIARNGMQALHTDLNASLERMSVSPLAPSAARTPHPAPARQRQIRILLTLHGRPRLPPHNEATWHTSSLYEFSPYSGLIAHHEVETIRPLPGEGVTEWLRQSLFGFPARKPEVADEPAVYPRASHSGQECGGADGVVRSASREK
ncbi:hypothetical protein VHUM_01692 [Vanrija humicola]|uniref:Uncharacterized protein n=1 Tax=Vanrija humicola TaxID=5417 RepID=A0A7D8Z428_VANHU|nr:hypothetical protein VHUM_01692 [Vanrija humicola]